MSDRVLLLTETMRPTSGWGRIAHEIVGRLERYGFEATVLTEDDSGNNGGAGMLKGSLASLKQALKSSWRTRRFVKESTLIHALDAYPYGLIGALGNIGIGRPLIMTAIGTYAIMPLESPKLRPLMAWAYRQADQVLPIVDYTAREIQKRLTNAPPMERVLLGVDVARFESAATTVSQPERPFFLSVGALKKRRGNHFVLPALALVKKHFPEVCYMVVGDQSDQAYVRFLEDQIKQYGLEENVRLLGKISEDTLRTLYQQSTAFIGIPENSPTNFAGFHLVYLEANAMGKPVIAGQGYGTEETINEGENGFLVNPEQPKAVAQILEKLLTDTGLREYMRKRCQEIAATLSWDKTVEAYVSCYRQLLNKK